MVYTPSARNLMSAMTAETGFGDPVRPNARTPARKVRPTAPYEVSWLRSDGRAMTARHMAPSTPPFEAAFSAFARGTLITTTQGPVAIEDLVPGMRVITHERGPSPLLWVGSMTTSPGIHGGHGATLTRVMADSLGMARPMTDLMAGPGARTTQKLPGSREFCLRPVQDFIDGMNVISVTPPSAVRLYHLALHRHATITAAGLTVETFHPGPGFENTMSPDMVAQFMAMFPHLRRPADFGALAHPRQPLRGSDGREVA